VTGSVRSLLRQASVLTVLCCALAAGPGQAFAQDPAPEPAPPKSSAPKPEAPPSAKREPAAKPATRVTPPPAPPPPPPATPPPAAVAPPVVVARVSQPPAAPTAPTRRDRPVQRREPAKATPKPKPKPNPNRPIKEATPAALSGLTREEATSPDTLLMVGGLALFFLVLADLVFLTLSTRVLRVR
jgi:hypothetical protein